MTGPRGPPPLIARTRTRAMLHAFIPNGSCLTRVDLGPAEPIPDHAVWIDLVLPTAAEDALVERVLGVSIPSRDEMKSIEASMRLYVEDEAVYMTATIVSQLDTAEPKASPVSFILSRGRLATVRYVEPLPFGTFHAKVQRSNSGIIDAPSTLLGLLESIIGRVADVVERVSAELDVVSADVFEISPNPERQKQARDYTRTLKEIGKQGNYLAKVEESLVSLNRLLVFLSNDSEAIKLTKDERSRVKILTRDVKSISDYAVYLDNKVTFLLDATLGLVNLQQATIVKIFSILAVIFMPPTLIASIYGMNFHRMPELDWAYGYPFALGLMALAVAVTYIVFRWRNWL
jgi:magnesium transporter